MLLPAVFAIAFVVGAHRGRQQDARRRLPGFLVAFALLVTVNSLGLLPQSSSISPTTSRAGAWWPPIAALGMKTSFKDFSPSAGARSG